MSPAGLPCTPPGRWEAQSTWLGAVGLSATHPAEHPVVPGLCLEQCSALRLCCVDPEVLTL